MTCLWKILNKTLEPLMCLVPSLVSQEIITDLFKNKQSVMNIVNRIVPVQIKFNEFNLIQFKAIP